MPVTLKERKEAFVSNLSGGEISEINLVTSLAVVGYLSWNLININTNLFRKEKKWEWGSLILDFILNWLVLLLSITLYASKSYILIGTTIVPVLSIAFLYRKKKSKNTVKKTIKKNEKELTEQLYLPKKPFITAYRGGMLIITALSILAVDFHIFPRRFAKVETWGTSLMDLGVGSFVFSMGIVSIRRTIIDKFRNKRTNYFLRLWKSATGSLIPLILGLLRVFFIKNLDYQEHVSEYGVHWNFFVTLVLVGPLSIILEPVFYVCPRFLLSIVISLIYEYNIVDTEGFLRYLLLTPREDFISANREGIFSLIGYLAIFLAGQSTGYYLLPSIATKKNLFSLSTKEKIIKEHTEKWSTLDKLFTLTPIQGLLIWFVTYISFFSLVQIEHDYTCSRRFANFPYVLWVCTYNTGALLLYAIVEKVFGAPESELYEDRVPISLDAINSNGMLLFLIANISTGLVNMSINTLDANTITSMTVLIGYSVWIATISAILYHRKIFIKI